MADLMGLLRVDPGSGLAAAVAAIQLRAVCPFDTEQQRAEQLPAPPLYTVSVIGGAFAYWTGDGWAPMGGGTTILDGTGPPAATLGALGNYYADTAAGVLYGPKVLQAAWGPPQTLIVSGASGLTDPVANVSNREGGVRVTFAAPGRVRQVRYRRRADSAGTLTVRAWNDDTQAKLAEIPDTQSAAGLFTVTFPTAVTVAAGTPYTFSIGATGAVPASGIVPAVTNTAGMTYVATRDATAGLWPNVTNTGATYYVEPIYEPEGATVASWPVTVRTIP